MLGATVLFRQGQSCPSTPTWMSTGECFLLGWIWVFFICSLMCLESMVALLDCEELYIGSLRYCLQVFVMCLMVGLLFFILLRILLFLSLLVLFLLFSPFLLKFQSLLLLLILFLQSLLLSIPPLFVSSLSALHLSGSSLVISTLSTLSAVFLDSICIPPPPFLPAFPLMSLFSTAAVSSFSVPPASFAQSPLAPPPLTLSPPQDVCNVTLSLWQKAPQDVCNVITKTSKFLFFAKHFSHFTYFLTYFHGSRSKVTLLTIKKKKN